MKFIVHEYGGHVNVTLHPDTKNDIKKALAWHGSIVVAGLIGLHYITKKA